MEIRDIYLYVCMYVCMYVCCCFSMVRSRTRLRITLTARRAGHFTWEGEALTNAMDISIAHTHTVEEKETN